MRRLEEYIAVGQKRLRCGYTTGTCAAAAARAAAELLLRGREVPEVLVEAPAGITVPVEVEDYSSGGGWARCAVRKDAGDDPDVTDGILVYAQVEWCDEPGIRIEGGPGVGRVTRPGLDQPVGEAAINSVPRQMIHGQVEEVARSACNRTGEGLMPKRSSLWELPTGHFRRCGTARGASPCTIDAKEHGGAPFSPDGKEACPPPSNPRDLFTHGGKRVAPSSEEGLLVTISVPGGDELAKRTFNPRLGIEGGISIIGTSGIVKPMSEEAMVASIELEMRMLAATGVRELLVVPGNYGRDFAGDTLGLDVSHAVQCSNYFGETLDAAVRLGFDRVLVVGHLGKMAKVAGGIMNTHSRVADCRMEVLAAHAALAGAPQKEVVAVMKAATTDAALDVLRGCGLAQATMDSLMGALAERLSRRVGDALQVEAVVFSRKHGPLGATPGAVALGRVWRAGDRAQDGREGVSYMGHEDIKDSVH